MLPINLDRTMRKQIFGFMMLAWALLAGAQDVRGLEPVDPGLIPEARKVLNYLETVYGRKTLTGMARYGGWKPVLQLSGREPAIYSMDAFGWNKPKFGPSYCKSLQRSIDNCHKWWHDKGGIVSMQFHWGKPGDPQGSAWIRGKKGTGPVDIVKTLTPGTPEHQAAMDDLSKTADYLEQLAKEKVPVLWRPFHEIDGGWFWWTDVETPENTAALWRMMFDYLVKERGLHNLIWVYSAAERISWRMRDASLEEQILYRRRFYPGKQYVDIAGIDIYHWGSPMENTFGWAFEMMRKIAPGKMLAMCECAALPNPELIKEQGPAWLYCLPWFSSGPKNPSEWVRSSFAHNRMLTLDELPPLAPHNVAPNVRIIQPVDGAETLGSTVQFRGRATDRDGNLSRVEIYLLSEAWRKWFAKKDVSMGEALSQARLLGKATVMRDGRWTFTLSDAPPGRRNFLAVARDADNAAALSNAVRLTIAVTNPLPVRTVTGSPLGR